jgi:hypothetical protein
MFRRYFIVNAVSTAIFYGSILAGACYMPSMASSITATVQSSAQSIVLGNALLEPVLYGMISVSANVFGGL